jgi:molybdopterin molybdotransferase
MLPFDEARKRVLALAKPLASERVAVDRTAGRVLAENVVAENDTPAYDQSTMDGYAVRAADCSSRRLPLQRTESRAGGGLPPPLVAGHAMRIFTGAPLPAGADAILIQ